MAWTHEHAWKLKATPSRVFAALTESSDLTTWFAEHVDIGDHVGASFRFWGCHTLDTPTAAQATQRISAWSRDRALAFTWQIAAVETEVAIAISAEGDGSRLLLHHTVSGTLPFPRERELLDDHWRYVFGNLAMHLAGGSGISLPDFSDAQPEVRQTILIDAPRDVVFHTLITPELVTQWFDAKSSVVEPRVGGRYELGWKYQVNGRDVVGGTTRIVEFVENERLVLDWLDWRGDASVTGQTITFQLETVGVQTRVTFVHAGFQRTADIGDYPFGWTYFVGKFKAVAEGGV
ncbi:MAG: SRPBCC family protein [Gemmatimonas sp.]